MPLVVPPFSLPDGLQMWIVEHLLITSDQCQPHGHGGGNNNAVGRIGVKMAGQLN